MLTDRFGRTVIRPGAFTFVRTYEDVSATRMPAMNGVFTGGRGMALGDVDGDDDPDLVMVNDVSTSDVYHYGYDYYVYYYAGQKAYPLKIFENDGDGNFLSELPTPAPVRLPLGTHSDGWQGRRVAFGDVDGDQDEDLFILSGGISSREPYSYYYSDVECALRILKNDGSGAFTFSADSFPDPSEAEGRAELDGDEFALGDLDGDDDPDLVMCHDRYASITYLYYYAGYYYMYSSGDYTTSALRCLVNDGTGKFTDV